uniref:Uncharacterized protein n=1 Tax=Anopheles epiroticus TaxID=199890 RepID=A0A182P121_9DIPT
MFGRKSAGVCFECRICDERPSAARDILYQLYLNLRQALDKMLVTRLGTDHRFNANQTPPDNRTLYRTSIRDRRETLDRHWPGKRRQ